MSNSTSDHLNTKVKDFAMLVLGIPADQRENALAHIRVSRYWDAIAAGNNHREATELATEMETAVLALVRQMEASTNGSGVEH